MNSREMTMEARLSHWSEVIHRKSASGLSIREYCKRAGFHESLYYYWQKKLRKATSEKLTDEKCTVAPIPTGLIPSGWALIGAESDAPDKCSENVLTIEVSGCQITVNAETDIVLITKVCRALVAL